MIDHLLALGALTLIIAAAVWPDPKPTPADGPACPHCGGGPIVPILGGATACQSCARIISRPNPR